MASTKPRQYTCIGTNRIAIIEGGQSSTDGMLSIFRRGNAVYDDKGGRRLSGGDDENNASLHLVITDGVDTFYVW
jgi:hypothetical protein